MGVAIARFPHAQDFTTAYEAFGLFVGIPLVLAFALRNTGAWWMLGAAMIALAVLTLPMAFGMPYGCPARTIPSLELDTLYAALAWALSDRARPASKTCVTPRYGNRDCTPHRTLEHRYRVRAARRSEQAAIAFVTSGAKALVGDRLES